MASLSQGRTAAAHCGLFTHKSVPVIFEPPCNFEKFCRSGQATDDNMANAHCIFEAKSSHSEYVIPTAFPLRQWLNELASVLRCKYIVCLVGNINIVTQILLPISYCHAVRTHTKYKL